MQLQSVDILSMDGIDDIIIVIPTHDAEEAVA